MKMSDQAQPFPKSDFDYVFLKNAFKKYAQPRRMIHEWIKKEKIIRIKKGLYTVPQKNVPLLDVYHLSNLIYGPSYISSHSALAYYQLIPEAVIAITATTCKKNKTFYTPVGRFEYKTIPAAYYALGVTQVTVYAQSVLMATPEKALLDLVWREKKSIELKFVKEFLYDDIRLKYGHAWNKKTLKAWSSLYTNKTILEIIKTLLKEKP